MCIDWKQLAQSAGYKSLKATYIKAAQSAGKRKNPMRKKDELLKHFNWVICRVKHYAYYTGKSAEEILNDWEVKRTYCWLNYYQDCAQPKFHSNSKKQIGIKGLRKHYKKDSWYRNDPAARAARVCSAISDIQMRRSTKTKSRWGSLRKKCAVKHREYLSNHG